MNIWNKSRLCHEDFKRKLTYRSLDLLVNPLGIFNSAYFDIGSSLLHES